MSNERRLFARVNFQTEGNIVLPEGKYPVDVLDISLKGALVEPKTALPLTQDQHFVLEVQLGSGEQTIYMEVLLAHQHENLLGLRCVEIDLDSITHLRRLVELNLGDEQLLNRELEALVLAAHHP